MGTLACAAGAATPAAAALFAPATTIVLSGIPDSVAVDDLDGDGRLDLAVGRSGAGDVAVLLGTGTGSFGAPSTFPAGQAARDVAAARLDGDEHLDLVVTNQGTGEVSVLLGAGGGAFGPATAYPAGTSPIAVAVGRLDGDGHADLAVTNFTSSGEGHVRVLLGTGTGGFTHHASVSTGANPHDIAVDDIDADGHADLVLATADGVPGSVRVLKGDGTGAFPLQRRFPVGTRPVSLALEDFDRDGRRDVAVTNHDSGGVSVLRGSGAGDFEPAATFPAGARPFPLVAGDFDGDGPPDLAAGNFNSADLSVLLGDGAGGFASPMSVPVGVQPLAAAARDLDADGRLDAVVVQNGSGGSVAVLLNTAPVPRAAVSPQQLDFGQVAAGGSSSVEAVTVASAGHGPLEVSAADVEGTDAGEFDVVADHCSGRTLAVGEECTVEVRFQPGSGGVKQADLSITHSASSSQDRVALAGEGLEPAAAVEPDRVDFGSVPEGSQSQPRSVTVESVGSLPLEVSAAAVAGPDAGEFEIVTDGCSGRSIPVGDRCTIELRFLPGPPGPKQATLEISHDGPSSASSVELAGRSERPAQCALLRLTATVLGQPLRLCL